MARTTRQVECRPHSQTVKKKGYRWKRTRASQRNRPAPETKALVQTQLIELEALAATGEIVLKYLDETGCCQWTPQSYSYSPIGEQKRFEQTSRRGQRVSILGVWDPNERFEYALTVGSFNTQCYIEVMDWLASKAAQTFAKTHQLSFIVQDNGSIHKSKAVRAA